MPPFNPPELVLLLLVSAIQTATPARDRQAIDHARTVIVKRLDATLPNQTLETWLRDRFGAAKTTWEVNDCGEQTGDPRRDRGRDFPMCVEVAVSLDGSRVLHLVLAVGSFKTGALRQPPTFVYGCIVEAGAPTQWLKSLKEARDIARRPSA